MKLFSDRSILALCFLEISASLAAGAETAPLTRLKQAHTAYEARNYDAAVRHLRAIGSELARLADYVGYLGASVEAARGNHDAAIRALEPVWRTTPASPLTGPAAVLGASCHRQSGQPAGAVALLDRYASLLPQPLGDMELGAAKAAAGDLAGAAAAYQRVYYHHPLSPKAAEATQALASLRARLGGGFPSAAPAAMLSRASALLRSEPAKARAEFQSLANLLTGADAGLARMRIGAADYFARRNAAALAYLRTLSVAAPEADAERLYYLHEAARRLDDELTMRSSIEELASKHPLSRWRLEALVSEGGRHLVENRADQYLPAYRACAESFAGDPQGALCHWRVAWAAYRERSAGAAELFREHLKRFPASIKANASLYFLGRIAEQAGDAASARVFYREVTGRYPNSYYALAAAGRLAGQNGPGSLMAEAFLRGVAFPARNGPGDARPSTESRARIERARLLFSAGLGEWGEGELRYSLRNGGQTFLLATELSEALHRIGVHDRGIQAIKFNLPDYLFYQPGETPESFWKLAFPMPYRAVIERLSRERGLDPCLIAGLIRQESEFNPRAISPARAYGLTQVLPRTGRAIYRQAGLKRFSTSMLFDPEANLRLGAYYFRQMLDSLNGDLVDTLAAYNAGKSRVTLWRSWGTYSEPAEFIESIPFTETRDYIQAVLRNAAMYRRLYGGNPARVPSSNGPRPAPAKVPQRKDR